MRHRFRCNCIHWEMTTTTKLVGHLNASAGHCSWERALQRGASGEFAVLAPFIHPLIYIAVHDFPSTIHPASHTKTSSLTSNLSRYCISIQLLVGKTMHYQHPFCTIWFVSVSRNIIRKPPVIYVLGEPQIKRVRNGPGEVRESHI